MTLAWAAAIETERCTPALRPCQGPPTSTLIPTLPPFHSSASSCRTCGRAFGMALRRHHCRMCGYIFCHECSSYFCKLANTKAPARTCQTCADVLDRLKQMQAEEIDPSADAGDSVSTRLRRESQGGDVNGRLALPASGYSAGESPLMRRSGSNASALSNVSSMVAAAAAANGSGAEAGAAQGRREASSLAATAGAFDVGAS